MKTTMRTALSLAAPESVAEQTARLEKEQEHATRKRQAETLAAAAAKPLIGSVGDIGQIDMAGGNDLFSTERGTL